MKKFKQSLKHAVKGIVEIYSRERNFRIHCLVGVAIVLLGFVLDISVLQWVLIVLCIGIVLALEATNTAIEYTWNHLEPNHHPVVGTIKDVMAGAVLIVSIMAAIAGVLVIVYL